MVNLLKLIFMNLFRQPATRLYPFVKREPFKGGRFSLDMDPALCIYCGICQRRCPANAIVVSREPKSWTMDPYKCIVCGYCAEVCPKKCIYMRNTSVEVK
ncbi:MAG: 4Fe-4S dicluster domain-containing protein [Candidatus Margulisiibacteriota bacterium]